MAKIDKTIVAHIAKLANLSFSEEELEKYEQKLASVVGYMAKLNEIETKNVEPTSHVMDVTGGMQEDVASKFDDVDKILENAPERSDRFFQVPKVI